MSTEESTATEVRRLAEFLRSNGRVAPADNLMRLLATPDKASPAVYVAGEAKRGKSCLVNALLSTRDLSPVGVVATTATPITFFYAETPTAQIQRFGEAVPTPVDVAQARALATVDGNPRNEENLCAVAIGVNNPLLAEFDLVDTPGVGGLDSGHGELTLQSLSNADALIFVIEAGAQIREAELQFLRRASARIETVIFVMTKIDTHRGWRTILDDNMAILRRQAPRFATCPVVAVSSVLALRGIASADPEDARALREESGISRLEEVLHDVVVMRASVLRESNLLRAGLGPLISLERTLLQQRVALQANASERQALQAEQARLASLNQDRATWPQVLDAEIRKLTLERQDTVARRAIEIRRSYDNRLKDLKKKDVDALPGELIADLTALASALNETTGARLSAIVRQLLTAVDAPISLEESIDELTDQSVRDELSSLSFSAHDMSHFEKVSLGNTFLAGRSVATLASGSGLGITAGALLVPPVGMALGFALGGYFAFQSFKQRKNQLFSIEFASWMRDQITQTQLTINNSFARGLIELQSQIRDTIRAALAAREAEINESLTTAKRLLDSGVAERRAALEQLVADLETVATLRKDVVTRLSELTSLATPPSPTPTD